MTNDRPSQEWVEESRGSARGKRLRGWLKLIAAALLGGLLVWAFGPGPSRSSVRFGELDYDFIEGEVFEVHVLSAMQSRKEGMTADHSDELGVGETFFLIDLRIRPIGTKPAELPDHTRLMAVRTRSSSRWLMVRYSTVWAVEGGHHVQLAFQVKENDLPFDVRFHDGKVKRVSWSH